MSGVFVDTYFRNEILIQFIKEDLDYNQILFNKLLGFLVQHLNDLLQEFTKRPLNLEKCEQLAHKAKSSCKAFGIDSLALKLEEFEKALFLKKSLNYDVMIKEITGLVEPSIQSLRVAADLIFKKAVC